MALINRAKVARIPIATRPQAEANAALEDPRRQGDRLLRAGAVDPGSPAVVMAALVPAIHAF